MFPFALLFGAVGAVTSILGLGIQASASAQEAKASQQAEALRQQQLTLESSRQRIQTIRNMIAAQSQAKIAASSQGAGFGSGIQGGLGSVTAKSADNIVGINQGESIGNGIFKTNSDIAGAQALAAFGGGLTSLGQTISGLHYGD